MIDRQTAEQIKAAANILDVVGDYVHLVRRGGNYMGLCPFHNERTPSFSVNPKRNFCYCFSCHEGGSPVNFLMKKEGISYQDALRRLAQRYNIEIHEREITDEERARQSERESMFIANQWAMDRMCSNLRNTEEGRTVGQAYFDQRGITDAALKRFNLGYSIDRGGDLIKGAQSEGYDVEVLKKLGLVGQSQEGRNYERFHGRVIFPVQNSAGKVVAFGGRDLTGKHPAKYINSPESAIYKKSNELYGFYQARNAIDRQDKCYLVEGYFDVIGMWQSGFENVVASSGTALTDNQINLIHRFTNNVTLIYDGDAAGIKASLRGVDMLLAHNLNVKVLPLPDGDDPDSFAADHTPEEFEAYIKENETDFIRFKIGMLMQEAGNDPGQKLRAVSSIVKSIACIPDVIGRNIYIQECARLLEMDEKVIAQSVSVEVTKHNEEVRRQRARQDIEAYTQGEEECAQPATPTPGAPTTQKEPVTRSQWKMNMVELDLLKYCARYGFADFSLALYGDGEASDILVIDYVERELEADGIQFRNPVHTQLYDAVRALRPDFEASFAKYQEELKADVDQRRKEGFEAISRRNLSSDSLLQAENELEAELEDYAFKACGEFASDFTQRHLLDHEDDAVRNLATKLISSKYQLSKVHDRIKHVESERDRLYELLPRAMAVLRNEIVKERRQEIALRISTATDPEEIANLQKEICEIDEFRKTIAPHIGDRVIGP